MTAVAEFDPTRISASRVNKLAECGVAFRMKYLENVPEDRTQPLFGLMQDAWVTETEECPVVCDFLAAYRAISSELIAAEQAAREDFEARNPGKSSQAPRMTRHFKQSRPAQALNSLLAEWVPKLNDGSRWKFTDRDPLGQFYDDSLTLATRYEAQWKHLPPSLYQEFEFTEEWRGFTLNGYIDSVEPLVDLYSGELVGVGVIDYKTYRQQPAEHKDYRQLVIYDAAVRSLVSRGALSLPWDLSEVPLYVGIDYIRYAGVNVDWLGPAGNSRRFWRIEAGDHDRLERELTAYRNTVEARNFLPADKGQKADFCDYGPLCCQVSTAAAGGSAERAGVNI
jgi:hypothetical protein